MAISLTKPQANIQSVFTPQGNDVIVLDFATSDATLARVDDNLTFTFEDGSKIVLNGFYNTYNSENMPTFDVDGAIIDGETFFAALDATDLMPAAGPTQQAVEGSSFNEFANADLIDGVDALSGLTLGNAGAGNGASQLAGAGAATVAAAGAVAGVTAPEVDTEAPTFTIDAGNGALITSDADLKDGEDSATGSFTASENVASFTVTDSEGNVLEFDADGVAKVEGGTLTVTVIGGEVTYTFTQDGSYSHEVGSDSFSQDFEITVTDASGNTSAPGTITVDITDDGPSITGDSAIKTVEGNVVEGSLNIDFGADATGATVTIDGVDANDDGSFTLAHGTVTIDAEGNYTYTANANATVDSDSFTVVVTDSDGDTVKHEVTVDIEQVAGPDAGDFVGNIEVNEAGLDDAGNASETVSWTVPEGYKIDSDFTANVTDAAGNVIGTAAVGADGEVIITLTDNVDHGGSDDGANTADSAGQVTITVTDGAGNDVDVVIDVDVVDDVPTINGITSETSVNDSSNNLENSDRIEFNSATIESGKGSMVINGITISAVKVTEQTDGSIDIVENGKLGHANLGSAGSGLTVNNSGVGGNGGGYDQEISHNGKGASEGILLDFGDKLAYGIDLNLSAFFSESGSSNDKAPEMVTLTFMKDGQVVKTLTLTSESNNGQFDSNGAYIGYVPEGFDSVVIAGADNGAGTWNNSDFLIKSVEFDTKPDGALVTTTGTVDADFGADDDGAGNMGITFNHANGETIETSLGTITLEVKEGSAGGGFITAYDAEGNPVFTATMGADGKWNFELHQEFQLGADGSLGDFELKFTVTDSDGDTADSSITIDSNPLPDMTNNTVSVDEAGLGDAANSSETTTWTPPAGFTVDSANSTIMDASGNPIGTVVVNADGSLTYTLNTNINHGDNNDGANTINGADTITVVLEDANGNKFEVEVNVDVTDDVPVITVGDTDSIQGGSTENVGFDLALSEGALKAAAGMYDSEIGNSFTVGGVTATAVKVEYNEDGSIKTVADTGNLRYTATDNSGAGAVNTGGLTVDTGSRNNEILAGDNSAEGIRFDLPEGEVSYVFKLGLDAFTADKGTEGTEDGQFDTTFSEVAVVNFYKDGVLVHTETVYGKNGTQTQDYKFEVEGGFDSVIVSPQENNHVGAGSDNSDFVIDSVEFGGKEVATSISTTSGDLSVDMGADGGASGVHFAYADGQTISTSLGDITIKLNTVNGVETMTALDKDGNPVFTAELNGDGKWNLELEQEFQVKDEAGKESDFELEFTTNVDTDGDTGTGSVVIDSDNDGSLEPAPEAAPTVMSFEDTYVNGGGDKLYGGDEALYGGEGNDYIDAGEGADTITGGAGDDIIVYDPSDNSVSGGSGNDLLIVGDGATVSESTDGFEAILSGSSATDITSWQDLEGLGISKNDDGSFTIDETTWEADGDTYTYIGDDTSLNLEFEIVANS